MGSFFETNYLFIFSMWKLNLGYGSLVVSVSGLIFSHNSCRLMFNFEKIQLIWECKLHSSIEMICKK
jgi:hypothetical protein